MSFIEIDKMTFAYPDGTIAVDNVSLNMEKGEKVAIIGQNGAGKTTMVKTLNGLLKPTEGDVVIDSWNTRNYTTAKMSQKVGYVFQNPMNQIFHNKVYSEIEYGPKMLKCDREEIKRLVDEAVSLTELEEFIEENPYNLPYSMRKFVTIASIIAMKTEVIIMDEPTAGQDLKGMKILKKVIDSLSDQGKTIITITHDMEFVVSNFDRIVVMANKKIIADGNKREIFWNHDILEKSKVKQPYISDLAKDLNIQGNVLNIEDFISGLQLYK